ncbi:MAG TPA: serine hydrolase domain-containing protein, partial [Ilumatobacter sp.]|nr:serine hydrolase domain-containing protein [Ilumatobacter sp.]
EFRAGERAEPTVVVPPASVPAGGERILPEDIEADAPTGSDVAVDQLFTVDDAGNAAPNPSGWRAFDEQLGRRLVPANVSASVAVMVDGRLVHHAAFGERVAGTGEPVETTDRFRIASISKTITAIVTMQLVDAGLLTLDDPVGPTVAGHLGLASYDPDVATITVRELLSHTAGFPQHEGTFFSNGATSCVDAATQGLRSGVRGGNGFDYSNMSYCVLGILIEAVTGKTYERVVHERLLTPLGISGMRMTSTYDLGPDEVSHHPTPNRNFMETLAAAGSWNATTADLVTIVNSIDPATPGWKALSDESMRAMRYRIPNALPPAGYGLGIINYGGDAWGHTGTIQNAHSMVLVQPDGVTWAITVSGEYPSESGNLRSIFRAALNGAFG